MTTLRPDQRLAGYRVIGALGRGGMAAVYRAHEAELDREVALKVLPAELLEQSGFAERFAREARLIARLEHPNIVPVYASGVDQGIPWMALRLVSGGTLQDLLEAGNLDQAGGLRLFRQIAKALDHAHRHDVLHRDLKPQNVLVSADGEVYLADFGIARLMAGSTALTGTGTILGTPHYMAPEQAQGEKLGPPCDIYALAVIVYRWLCGAVPFDADTPLAVLMQHVQAPVPIAPMSGVPAPARAVLLKGLAKDPAARWESATAMIEALDQALNPASVTVPGATTGRATASRPQPRTAATLPEEPGPSRSSRAPIWLFLTALLVLAGAWAAYRWSSGGWDGEALVRDPTDAPIETAPPPVVAPEPPSTAGPQAEPEQDELVGQLQQRLNRLGYALTLSAQLDGPTRNAIAAFRADRQLPTDAPLDAALLAALDNEITRRDLAAWQQALDEDSASAYEAYAQAHPQGQFRDQVDARLAALTPAQQPPVAPPAAMPAPTPRMPAPAPVAAGPEPDRAAQDAEAEALAAAQAQAAEAAAERAQRISEVQQALVRLGRSVSVDGQLDAATRTAIIEYEKAKGLAPSGEPSEALLAALQAASHWPDPGPGQRFRDCAQCPEMVVIPAGVFSMGSPPEEPQRQPTEGPRRQVAVASFAMARTEVTFAQWDACLAEGGCTHRPADQGWGGGQRPVVDVSWNDAQEYLAWLRRKTGRDYRLPSEAQWEYAARGGTSTRVYAGSCLSSAQANYNAVFPATGCAAGEFRQQSVPVASFAPNPWGLHDVHGNVWEWVQDCWNDSYTGAGDSDQPRLSGDCRNGTVRGGAWHDWGFWVRAASRYSFPRQSRHAYGGFRPASEVR